MKDKSGQHYFDAIYKNHHALDELQMRHIVSCKKCTYELSIVEKMEESIRKQPIFSAPAILRSLIFSSIMKPRYTFWQIFLTALLLLLCPLFIHLGTPVILNMYLGSYIKIFFFLLFGILNIFILVPVAFELFGKYRQTLLRMVDSIDGSVKIGSKHL